MLLEQGLGLNGVIREQYRGHKQHHIAATCAPVTFEQFVRQEKKHACECNHHTDHLGALQLFMAFPAQDQQGEDGTTCQDHRA